MTTYYVKKGEVYKVSATTSCIVYDGSNNPIATCAAGSIATFNAPTAKITLSDDNAVLTCLSEVAGDLSGLSEHVNNSSIHTTPTDKSRWNSVAGDLSDVENHIDDSDIHVTSNEKNSWTTSSNELSTIKTQLGGFAPLNSPSFTGTPSAPTASTGTSNDQVATTLFVHTVASSKQDKKVGTASRVLVTDSEGNIVASSDIDTTELGYLNGVSSNIQSQINSAVSSIAGKQDVITGSGSTITSNNLTASRALVTLSTGKIGVSSVTGTELGYLDGVTSNVQKQLNNRLRFLDYSSIEYYFNCSSVGGSRVINKNTDESNRTFTVSKDCLVIFQVTNHPIGAEDLQAITDLKIFVDGKTIGNYEVTGTGVTMLELPFKANQKITLVVVAASSDDNPQLAVHVRGIAYES